ncbi:MAG: toll/interleukin-1 receptor domain-containing protein [Hyphomonadaceae bacterium]|nr:toll/interleukin-1 receptor domain-containing protein [Hyphomonadaceae bacterium]
MAKIFISYRRDDSKWAAGRVREALDALLGPNSVFMDTADIVAGQTFKDTITTQIRNANVVVAVIGQNWEGRTAGSMLLGSSYRGPDVLNVIELTAKLPFQLLGALHRSHKTGEDFDDAFKNVEASNRLWQSDDMVRHELEQALALKKPILPVLIDGASIPEDIPYTLAPLRTLHHLKMTHESFHEALPTLLKAIQPNL